MPIRVFHRHGFTLVELLVATSIIVVIGTIAVLTFRQTRQSDAIRNARNGIMRDILDMQSYSVRGRLSSFCLATVGGKIHQTKACYNPEPSPSPGECGAGETCNYDVPSQGYGVVFAPGGDTSKYILFADIDPDGESGTQTANGLYDDAEKILAGEKTLPADFVLSLSTTYVNTANTTANNSLPIHVVFKRDGSLSVKDSAGNTNIRIQKIIINDAQNNIQNNLFINAISGLIYTDTPAASPSGSPSGSP